MRSARFMLVALAFATGAPAMARAAQGHAPNHVHAQVKVKEEKPGLLAKARVPADAAIAAAREKRPEETLTSAEIEAENGRLVYTIEFKTKGKTGIDEVNVDAMTGAVLAVEHESPQAEAAEKAADAKAAKAKRAR